MARSAFYKIYDDQKKAASMSARADLMIAAQKLIGESGMSNAQVSRMLGVSRSSVSELMNGKISRISLDALTEWLDILSEGELRVGVIRVADASQATSRKVAVHV